MVHAPATAVHTDRTGHASRTGRTDHIRQLRWSPRTRKLLLTVHVCLSVGWIGVEASLLALELTGLTTRDPELMRAAYLAVGLFGGGFIAPVAIGTLLSGLALSIGTQWGLIRYYWVLTKFVITVALMAGGINVLGERLQLAAARVSDLPSTMLTHVEVGAVRFQLLVGTTVALLLLVTATALSLYKPWGRTRFGRRVIIPASRSARDPLTRRRSRTTLSVSGMASSNSRR
jgi:hypothetical protein